MNIISINTTNQVYTQYSRPIPFQNLKYSQLIERGTTNLFYSFGNMLVDKDSNNVPVIFNNRIVINNQESVAKYEAKIIRDERTGFYLSVENKKDSQESAFIELTTVKVSVKPQKTYTLSFLADISANSQLSVLYRILDNDDNEITQWTELPKNIAIQIDNGNIYYLSFNTSDNAKKVEFKFVFAVELAKAGLLFMQYIQLEEGSVWTSFTSSTRPDGYIVSNVGYHELLTVYGYFYVPQSKRTNELVVISIGKPNSLNSITLQTYDNMSKLKLSVMDKNSNIVYSKDNILYNQDNWTFFLIAYKKIDNDTIELKFYINDTNVISQEIDCQFYYSDVLFRSVYVGHGYSSRGIDLILNGFVSYLTFNTLFLNDTTIRNIYKSNLFYSLHNSIILQSRFNWLNLLNLFSSPKRTTYYDTGLGTVEQPSPLPRRYDFNGDIHLTGQVMIDVSNLPPLVIKSLQLVEYLNADLLDGKHLNDFAPAQHTHRISDITELSLSDLNITVSPDLDTLDGHHLSDFAPANHTHSEYALVNHTHSTNDITNLSNQYYTKADLQTAGESEVHWDNITNKPDSYKPQLHKHTTYDILNLSSLNVLYLLELDTIDGYHLNQFALANHTHMITDIINLSELSVYQLSNLDTVDGKHLSDFAAVNHTHSTGDITDIYNQFYTKQNLNTDGELQIHWNNITNKPSTYTPSAHTHVILDITNLSSLSVLHLSNADTLDNYHASTTPGANKIPVADANGKLDPAWLPATSGGSTSGGSTSYTTWHILNSIDTKTRYIPYAANCILLTPLQLVTNRIYYVPFIPPINITVTSLAVEVTTLSLGTGQIGIYNTSNFRPSELIISSVVSIDTGATGVKSGTVNVSLVAGQLYWLALTNTSTVTLRAVAVGGMQPILGIATGTTSYNTHYYGNGSGGTLPATANATINGTGNVPAIYITYTVN